MYSLVVPLQKTVMLAGLSQQQGTVHMDQSAPVTMMMHQVSHLLVLALMSTLSALRFSPFSNVDQC